MTEQQSATLDGTGSSDPGSTLSGARSVSHRLPRAELVRWADRTADACVVLACVLVPLYFPGGTSIPADAHKSIPLIAIAAIAAAAWLVGACITGDVWGGRGVSKALLVAGLAVVGSYALATALSINPQMSFVGTLDRNQGLLTHAAYGVLFLCAATRLRRRDQIDRLMAALLIGSVPVVLYGIAQQAGIDPLPSAGDLSTVQWPVRSSFGNHVFFGAYLVLLIPLTAACLFTSVERDWRAGEDGGWYRQGIGLLLALVSGLAYLGYLAACAHRPSLFVLMPALLGGYAILGVALHAMFEVPAFRRGRTVLYGALLPLQIAVLVMTSARGALLGVVATLPVFALLAAWRLRRPRIAAGILGCVVLAGAFVLALNIPGGPLESLRTAHAFNRAANIGEYASESSGAGRLLIWHGFATLMTDHPAIGSTWGGIGRDLVGYGPESQAQAFEAVFPLKLRVETAETYTWDSAHSMYLDILVDAGALALLAFVATILLFFARTLRAVVALRQRGSWLTIGLISAVVGQLIEGIFGLEAAGSLVVFWVVLGLGAGPSVSQTDTSGAETPGTGAPEVAWLRPALAYGAGLVAALALVWLIDLTEHPTLFTLVWLAGILAGIAGLVSVAPSLSAIPAEDVTPAGVERPTVPVWIALSGGLLAIMALSALAFPWQTESAAIAETAGFKHVNRADVTQGLGLVQQAARDQTYEPRYREDLAVVYFALAQRNTPTGAPGYVPGGNDALSIDPQGVLSLDRSQLFGLGILSLRGAESDTPLDPYVHELLGNAYLQWGKTAQARTEYLQAQSLSHDNPRYIDDLALVALSEGRPQKALGQVQQAMRLDSTFWFSYATRALIYDQLQQPALARTDAKLALVIIRAARASPSAQQMAQLRRLARDG